MLNYFKFEHYRGLDKVHIIAKDEKNAYYILGKYYNVADYIPIN